MGRNCAYVAGMGRPHDTLIPPHTSWLNDAKAARVCEVIASAGHNIYFVGGCVRNALLGMADSDIDLSTDARPEVVMALAQAAGVKALPTGIDHGTVTLVVQGAPFEVTTFRRDVETDGRRAVVAFSTDIGDDARRRDFTMNALYATPAGVLLDPLGGLPDLMARKVRFIEDAQARIREDYLRTLRFFRFSAHFADPAQGFDPEALDAVAQNLDGLARLSAERIGGEMLKLLAAPDPAPAVAAMRQTGVLQAVLPGADDRFVAMIVHFEGVLNRAPDPLLRLAALGGEGVPDRLRLSKADAKVWDAMRAAAYDGGELTAIAYRHSARVAAGALMQRHCLSETPPDPAQMAEINAAAAQIFPIKAADLMPAYTGPALGKRMKQLEEAWVSSGFTLSEKALLALPDA